MKFIATDELGRLAKWLRILGFDTVLEKDKRSIVIRSLREGRVILTRDSKMSRFSGVRLAKIESDFVEEQLERLIKELDLKIDADRLFTICVLCDEKLIEVKKEDVKGRVPDYVFDTQEVFMRCPKCRKIYWQGTHWELVNKFLGKVRG